MRDERDREKRGETQPSREENLLARLPGEVPPPPELEERVARALRSEGLLGGEGGRRRWRPASTPARLVAAAVVAALLFGVGWVAGGGGAGGTAPGPPGDRYLLLLYEGEGFRAAESEIPRLVAEYSAWARELHGDGQLLLAEKLESGGRVLTAGATGLEVRSGTPVAAEGSLAGFYLITARSWEEAVRIAAAAPHLRYGGQVALRRIEAT